MKPTLAITMGDINGIGPEVLVRALARPETWQQCNPIVIGSVDVFERVRQTVPACPEAARIGEIAEARFDAGTTPVLGGDIPCPAYQPAVLSPEAGHAAIQWVKRAIRLAMTRHIDGLVTCPINKEGIHRAGYDYAGHTELLAEMTSTPDYRMSLFSDALRIVHVTSHLSLREAIACVTRDRIEKTVQIAHEALTRLALTRRAIAVAGLNCHAGEAGAFGSEDRDEILPAVQACRASGVDCSGPHPPDTVFVRMKEGEFDLVVAMYHDQGHIAFKMVALDEGVNVTLGLPIVRTSVDHGTAYDIAGNGVAREGSLCAAVSLAARLATTNEPHNDTRRTQRT